MSPTKPVHVAALRGLLWALVAAVVAVVVAATPVELEALGPAAPVVLLGARVLEAALLDRKQPTQLGAWGGKGPA